jgi:hypothetical protein
MDENKYRKFKRGLCISFDKHSSKTCYFVLAHFPCKWRRQCIDVVRTQIITFQQKAQCFAAHWAWIASLISVWVRFQQKVQCFAARWAWIRSSEFSVRSDAHAGWVLLTIYTLDFGMTVPNRKTVLMIRSQGNPTHQNDTLSLYAGVCCGMIKMARKCKFAG